MAKDGISEAGFWLRQILQYVDRARIFGLDNPRGRQAMAKCYMTMCGFLESMVRVYGPLPKPGLSSGYIEAWEDAPDHKEPRAGSEQS